MSHWSLYFLAKVGLFYNGNIGFLWGWNLLLVAVLVWPIASARGQRVRRLLAWPAAIGLLYHESFLPTPERLPAQLKALSGFSGDYLLELAQRVIKPMDVVAVAVAVLAYSVLARRVRFSTLALLAILSVPVVALIRVQHPGVAAAPLATALPGATATAAPATGVGGGDPESQLNAFYAAESQRKLVFSAGGQTPPFDLIVLNVCSLSWDDMDFVGMRDHPLMQRFDAVFTQFNSGASYSGPSMIRLMHGTCGQMPQKAMYDDLDPQCYTFPSLEKIGYRTAGLLNHDGTYEGYGKTVEKHGGLTGKIDDSSKAPIHMRSFYGSPIYSDHALLSQWWKDRQTKGAQPVALFYNTISLHDGNLVPGLTSRSSLDTFKPRLTQLLADFDKFISELETTGRPVVVMLLPEHGASLRGDKLQISGMREIPGSRITLVPVAVKVVGMPRPAGQTGPLLVEQPTSYFGLFTLLNDLLGQTPYGPTAKPMAERLKNLPSTAFVSQNEDVVVTGNPAQGYQLRSGAGSWIPYAQ